MDDPIVTTPEGEPITDLTPAEQEEINQAAAAPAEPQMVNPYQTPQYLDDAGKPVKLSLAEQKEYRQKAGLVDPIYDMTPDELVDLSRQTMDDPANRFNILSAVEARQDEIQRDPDTVNRMAEAWKKYRDSTGLHDLPGPKKMAENIWSMVKGLATQAATVAYNEPKALLAPKGSAAEAEALRNVVEAGTATRVSLAGLGSKVLELFQPPEAPLQRGPKETSQRSVEKLFRDLETAKEMREIIAGQGRLIDPQVAEELAGAGFPVRPEEVQNMAAGDAMTMYLFGKAFSAVTKPIPALVSPAKLAAAGEVTAAAAGATISAAAKAAAATAPKVAAVLPTAGAVKGAVTGSAIGAPVEGIALGYGAGRVAAGKILRTLPTLKNIEAAGQQIAGKAPVTSAYTQLAKDVLQSAPAAAYEVGKGAAFDIAFAQAAETPEEAQGVGIGTFFGLLGGGARTGIHVLSGQLIAPRGDYAASTTPVPPKGFYPELNTLHNQQYSAAEPGVRVRVNAARGFVRALLPDHEFIFAGRQPVEQIQARIQELVKQGIDQRAAQVQAINEIDPLAKQLVGMGKSPEVAADWSSQLGLSTKDLRGHKLIIARDIGAAPHEAAGHGLEDVLGESAMRAFDQVIQSNPQYKNNWEAIAQSYARPLGWDPSSGETWQQAVLRITGYGMSNAAEKLLRQQIGEGPYEPGQAEAIWRDSVTKNGGDVNKTWQSVLTPAEQNEVANRFISREIFAEGADAAYKHTGGFTIEDNSLPAKIARTVGSLVSYLGGEPLAGRVSEVRRFPLSYDLLRAQTEAVKSLRGGKPTIEVPPSTRRGATPMIPATPEQQDQAAEDARILASQAPDTPNAGGTRTTREILGQIAEAIAQRTGIKINYLSAPDQPAAAIASNRGVRRSIIEFFRSVPAEARSLWEKFFFPERVIQLKDGSYQVMGWSPEVFASNAHKTALAISDMISQDPANANLSPYPIDPKTGTFTPEGWRQLYKSTQAVVQNYLSGRTGSGLPLVVPKEMKEAGVFAPSLQTGVTVSQAEADFISALFGFKLPQTPRITGGKMPLSIVGAEVSEATLPGRTAPPVEPRLPFTGEKAEAIGIEGRQILEVNPFRNQLEQASKATGVPMPSLIEAIQRLNLNGIKEVQHAPELPQFRGNTLALSAGFQPPEEAPFQAKVNPEPPEIDTLPEGIKGATVSRPQPLYHIAAEQEGNPWIRRSADPSRSQDVDNLNRTLLVQISSDLINPESLAGAKDEASKYYDLLYSGARPGYARLQDFWEIPQWIGYASHFIPDADVYVVRDLAQAKQFLNEAGYGRVAMSALDTNKAMIAQLADGYQGNIDVGGYVDPKFFSDLPNVKWHDTMESLANDMGLPYEEGVDYRHFQGSDVIPRLTMSKGCRHKCAFCTVPKTVEETGPEVVRQQADAIAKLGSKLVYLNDKTFGQASNYKQLSEINEQIKAQNPDFQGFVIQTTAAQLKIMPADWLAKSGIKFVELGVESYNDPILKAMHKPATESLINQVTDKLRQAKIALIPNIIIGFPQETADTYARTLDFLRSNKDIISHANIYNLALYKDAELGKQIVTGADSDFNENVLEKSFHTNPEVHRQFAGDVYGLASEMLQGKPESAQFQPNTDPRAIKWPAVRYEDEEGRVWTYAAPRHAEAEQKLTDALGFVPHYSKITDGFVTNEGSFLDRRAAYKRAVETGQYTQKSRDVGMLIAEETEGMAPRDMSQFQPKAVDENVQSLDDLPDDLTKMFPSVTSPHRAIDP